MSNPFKTLTAAVVLSLLAGSAYADAIDGNWCHTDGRRFIIHGPEIVTPGGKRMEGNYSRHWFTYTAPALEPGAGQTVQLSLADENTVYLRLGDAAAPEVWVRCSPSVSALEMSPPS